MTTIYPWIIEGMHELRPIARVSPIFPLCIIGKNRSLLIKICPDFIPHKVLGICKSSEVTCCASFCEMLHICRKNCVSFCLAHSSNACEMTDFVSKANVGINILEQKLNDLLNSSHHELLASELIIMTECKLIDVLSFRPGDLTTIISIREWMAKENLIPFKETKSVQSKEAANQIWNIFVTKQILEFWQNMIKNDDAKIFVRKDKNIELVSLLQKDPIRFIEKIAHPSPEEILFKECLAIQVFESKKMLLCREWCACNELHYAVQFYQHVTQRDNVLSNKQKMKEQESIRLEQRFEASYPIFRSIFNVCRSLYFSNPFFRHVVDDYKNLVNDSVQELQSLINPYFWDEIVWQLTENESQINIMRSISSIKTTLDSKLWPIRIFREILPLSALLFLITSSIYSDITVVKEDIGDWFENLVEKEIEIRRIPIIAKKLPLPSPLGGDLDLICYDDRAIYLIEAKDYGPRSNQGYFSSRDYEKRINELKKYIDKFSERLNWLQKNRDKYYLPSNLPIRGVVLTSHIEPHLKVKDSSIDIIYLKGLPSLFPGIPIKPKIYYDTFSIPGIVIFKNKHQQEHLDLKWEKQKLTGIKAIVEKIIIKDFGSIEAFKVYKYIWEIWDAKLKARESSLRGFGVGEIAATQGRGIGMSCTFWHILYITFNMELFTLHEIKEAFQSLLKKEMIKIDSSGDVFISKVLPIRRYRVSKGKPVLVSCDDDADIILYSGKTRKGKNFLVSGFIDLLVRHHGKLAIVELKAYQ